MKQQFRFKLEDGTVVTGGNPAEALMKVNAQTTGKTLDNKFGKKKKNLEKEQALADFEKLYNGYIELEKKLRSREAVKTTPDIVEVKEDKIGEVIEIKTNPDSNSEKNTVAAGTTEENQTPRIEPAEDSDVNKNPEFKPGIIKSPSVLLNAEAADRWLEGNLVNDTGEKRLERLAQLKLEIESDKRISDSDKVLCLEAIDREEDRLKKDDKIAEKTEELKNIIDKSSELNKNAPDYLQPAQELKADFYGPALRPDGSFPMGAVSLSENSLMALKFEKIPGKTDEVYSQLILTSEIIKRALTSPDNYILPMYDINSKSKTFDKATKIIIMRHATLQRNGNDWIVTKKGEVVLE